MKAWLTREDVERALLPEANRIWSPAGIHFRQGSMGRTLAHELGHVLGLRHPDKRTQSTFGRLMGGRKAGYRLTDEEIETARAQAVRKPES